MSKLVKCNTEDPAIDIAVPIAIPPRKAALVWANLVCRSLVWGSLVCGSLLYSLCAFAAGAPGESLLVSVREEASAEGAPGGRTYSSADAGQPVRVQQVRVVDGARALIRLQQSIPITSHAVGLGPRGAFDVETTDYRSQVSAISVIPRRTGDAVSVELRVTQSSAHSPTGLPPGTGPAPRLETQDLLTTVRGRLGEWIEVSELSRQPEPGRVLNSTSARPTTRRLWLKVDPVR